MIKISTANKILSVITLTALIYTTLPLLEKQDGCVDAQCVPLPLALPIGTIFPSVSASNPAALLGYGTWVPIAQGRVLIGEGTGTGLTPRAAGTELGIEVGTNVQHRHTMNNTYFGHDTEGGNGDDTSWPQAANTGWSGPVATDRNMQPSLVVYFWERTG